MLPDCWAVLQYDHTHTQDIGMKYAQNYLSGLEGGEGAFIEEVVKSALAFV